MPYSFGGAHLALSNLLCLVGAVLGGAGAWALKRYGTDLFHSDKGAPDWLVGALRPSTITKAQQHVGDLVVQCMPDGVTLLAHGSAAFANLRMLWWYSAYEHETGHNMTSP